MPAYLKPLGKGRPVILDKPILFVGRHPECDIILLNSRKVSRKHCCIAQVNNGFRIRDLGSTNGISVNGNRIRKEAEVAIGDEISFGDVVYQLLNGEAPREDANSDSVQSEVLKEVKPPRSDTPESIELSQEFPVVIDEDEPVSISKLGPAPDAPAPQPSAKPAGTPRKKQEDSDSDVILLDESEYFYEDDDED